jgi:hypothetical protein
MAFRILDLAARLLLALGVGCLLLAAFLAWRSLAFTQDTGRAIGEVVSYHEVRDGDTTRYRPRIRFKTVTGEIISTSGQLSWSRRRFDIGARLPVVYKVQNPVEARVDLFVDNWLGPCLAVAIGLVGIAGGLLVRRSMRRELARVRP